jgi:UDP-glucose 4-epimerase
VDRLIEEGFDVSVVDDLSSGRKKNLERKAEFSELDVCSPKLQDVFRDAEPEYVVHQAAQINVRKSIEDPVFDANVNVLGSLNLLEGCRKFDVKKIVYASSGGAVYGEPQYLPVDEKHPINPLCPYGASKHAVEHYLEVYRILYGIDYTALRYANVYGPRQDPFGEAGVVAIFTKKLLSGKPPTIFGDGKQTRDFVYVEDVAEANFLALKKKTKEKVLNIGAGVESSVNEVTLKLAKILKSSVRPIHGPAIKGEVRRIYLDVSLARKELGWKPKVSLEAGLKKTVEYFKEHE